MITFCTNVFPRFTIRSACEKLFPVWVVGSQLFPHNDVIAVTFMGGIIFAVVSEPRV